MSVVSGKDAMRPQLRKPGHVTQLYVNDKPLLLTAGELRNSASSSREWMADVWDKCRRANLNSVLAVVPWDMMEPDEGTFDFSLIDHLIDDARAHGLMLIPLWFGAWKNGLSHYAPTWVKKDTKRFQRARIGAGNTEILSPLGEETRTATAKAFAALMRHIRERDAGTHTIPMIQVENEAGLRGDTRDRSAVAEAAWASQVPAELMDYLKANPDRIVAELRGTWSGKQTGTWSEVFGDTADGHRAFMAWHYSRFIEHSAAAGKAEYNIPMFVNAVPGGQPGGPRADSINIWQAGAPSIDILGPDIYSADFETIFQSYNKLDNPMFIPEGPAELEGASAAYYSIGRGALGYSPFGVEERIFDFDNGPMSKAYGLLNMLAPQILERQAQNKITSAKVSRKVAQPGNWKLRVRTTLDQPVQTVELGGYRWIIKLNHYWRTPEIPMDDMGYCLIMEDAPDEFTVAGYGVQIASEVVGRDDRIAALLSVDELMHLDGAWKPRRRLNGDEIITSYEIDKLLPQRQTGTEIKFWLPEPQVLKVKLYSYET